MEKIDGSTIKRARLSIRKRAGNVRGTTLEPAEGTIGWLAKASGCSEKTIKIMEQKGIASLETLDKVSPHLGLTGRLLIRGYGDNDIACEANGYVDFRPATCPWDDDLNYQGEFISSPMVFTIDPITFIVKWDELKSIDIQKISVEISGLKNKLQLVWLYVVSMTENTSGWLGIKNEAWPFTINLEEEIQQLHIPVMFRQNNDDEISWANFIDQVYEIKDHQLRLDVNVTCGNFEKKFSRFLSVDSLKKRCYKDCEKREIDYPVKVQCPLIGY